MSKLQQAIDNLHEADREAAKRNGVSRIHPVSRLLVCVAYIGIVVSFHKYDIGGLLGMSLFIVITGILEDLSFVKGFQRIKYILVFVVLLGAVNLFLDRSVIMRTGSIIVTGGMISMITLLTKGILTVYSTYYLFMYTGIEQLCRALRCLKVPKGGVTVVLLIYRYIIVLLKEIQRMSQAYQLRAPGQKGIHIKAWGSYAGLLLLRSMERAQNVYDSMLLRGYDGEFQYEILEQKETGKGLSIVYAAGWIGVFILLRFVPVFQIIGNVFISASR